MLKLRNEVQARMDLHQVVSPPSQTGNRTLFCRWSRGGPDPLRPGPCPGRAAPPPGATQGAEEAARAGRRQPAVTLLSLLRNRCYRILLLLLRLALWAIVPLVFMSRRAYLRLRGGARRAPRAAAARRAGGDAEATAPEERGAADGELAREGSSDFGEPRAGGGGGLSALGGAQDAADRRVLRKLRAARESKRERSRCAPPRGRPAPRPCRAAPPDCHWRGLQGPSGGARGGGGGGGGGREGPCDATGGARDASCGRVPSDAEHSALRALARADSRGGAARRAAERRARARGVAV